jgi:hypothetical protein
MTTTTAAPPAWLDLDAVINPDGQETLRTETREILEELDALVRLARKFQSELTEYETRSTPGSTPSTASATSSRNWSASMRSRTSASS